MRFELARSRSRRQPWFWRIRGGNGQVLAVSETYANKSDAEAAANSVRNRAAHAPLVEVEDEPRRWWQR